jgi:hypothetical protein
VIDTNGQKEILDACTDSWIAKEVAGRSGDVGHQGQRQSGVDECVAQEKISRIRLFNFSNKKTQKQKREIKC